MTGATVPTAHPSPPQRVYYATVPGYAFTSYIIMNVIPNTHTHTHAHTHTRTHKYPLTPLPPPTHIHSGLLLDTARHFLPLPALRAAVVALAAVKMNTLHWHAVDDQVGVGGWGWRWRVEVGREGVEGAYILG